MPDPLERIATGAFQTRGGVRAGDRDHFDCGGLRVRDRERDRLAIITNFSARLRAFFDRQLLRRIDLSAPLRRGRRGRRATTAVAAAVVVVSEAAAQTAQEPAAFIAAARVAGRSRRRTAFRLLVAARIVARLAART